MRSQLIFFTTLLAFTILLVGCGGATSNSEANTKPANTSTTNSSSQAPLSTTKKTEAATTNNAPTLGPIVLAYYDALKKSDDAAVRKVMSENLLKESLAGMKADKKTSLTSYLAEFDRPEGEFQVRNEKIEGNRGVAEVKGGAYSNWTPLAFVLENGSWKISNENPDINAVTKGGK